MRIAVLSDIHSNLVALDAVLVHAGALDAVWHLGDVVGYGPEPDGVVARLAEVGAVGVRGNHDAAAIGGLEIEWFNPEARTAIEWTRDRISPATRGWLAAHPEVRVMSGVTLVHGSPRDPLREYITSEAIAGTNLEGLATPHGLHGHTHVPVAFVANGDRVRRCDPPADVPQVFAGERSLLNPGSVGQPRDGDPRASYLVLDPETMTATWHRVDYDIAAVQAAMSAAALPGRLIDRLAYGE